MKQLLVAQVRKMENGTFLAFVSVEQHNDDGSGKQQDLHCQPPLYPTEKEAWMAAHTFAEALSQGGPIQLP